MYYAASLVSAVLAIWLWRFAKGRTAIFPILGGLFDSGQGEIACATGAQISDKIYHVLIQGELRVPRKIYVGDSHNISLLFRTEKLGKPSMYVFTFPKECIQFTLRCERDDDNFLEVELQAATATISGERTQRLTLPSSEMFYRWNCYFSNSGNHEIGIIVRHLVRTSADGESAFQVKLIGTIDRKVKVVKLDGLTQLQVWVLASTLGFISGLLAVVKILHETGFLRR